MIIFKDIISEDEMFSDIYKITESDSGAFYRVQGKQVCRSSKFDDALIGANASAEEQCEGTDDAMESGIDIVLNHNLVETGFTKKQFMTYLKGYFKAVVEKLKEIDAEKSKNFKDNVKKETEEVLAAFKDYQFFTGESMNPDGMVALLNYDENSEPYMLFFRDALLQEKC